MILFREAMSSLEEMIKVKFKSSNDLMKITKSDEVAISGEKCREKEKEREGFNLRF